MQGEVTAFASMQSHIPFLIKGFKKLSSCAQKDLIIALRSETDAPFSLCREAALFSNLNQDVAINYIRNKLRIKSDNILLKKKPLTNGLIAVGHNTASAVLLKVDCGTDFVAKTPLFHRMAAELLSSALSMDFESNTSEPEHFEKSQKKFLSNFTSSHLVVDKLKETSGLLGESVQVSSLYKVNCSPKYVIGIYSHTSNEFRKFCLPFEAFFGRIGSLVLLKNKQSDTCLTDVAREIARQVTGINPFERKSTNYEAALVTLLGQNLLTDSSSTVRELLELKGTEISAFFREEQLN